MALSTPLPAASAADIAADFKAIADVVQMPVGSAAELKARYDGIWEAVFAADLNRYDPVAVRAVAPGLILEIFDLRCHLREEVPEWHARGYMTHAAQKALREVLAVSRYATDMLGELMIGHDRWSEGRPLLRVFSGRNLNTLVSKSFDRGGPLPFQAGDVLLVRGTLHNSAAIARIGDTSSQFSHIGIIDIDEQGGHHVVESLIEDGAIIKPLDEVLGELIGRAMIFRHRDPELAARAARSIRETVARSLAAGGTHIPYDFTMLLRNYRQLFCAKLVRAAFDLGSDGRVLLPTFATRFNDNRDFYRRIGVKAKATFAPGDIEVEPGFQLVAEWQDYRVTSRLRLQDMIMTKLFEWMQTHKYRFREDFSITLIGIFGRLASHLSERAKTAIKNVVPKVPANMPRRTIATIAMLHKTADPILRELEAAEVRNIETTGRPLHPREVLAQLEARREASDGRIGYLATTGPIRRVMRSA